jgi:uncharacterized protein YqhQ
MVFCMKVRRILHVVVKIMLKCPTRVTSAAEGSSIHTEKITNAVMEGLLHLTIFLPYCLHIILIIENDPRWHDHSHHSGHCFRQKDAGAFFHASLIPSSS